MKNIKKILALVVAVCLMFCMTACGEGDEYDNFDPVGVRVVETIGTAQFETVIEDKETTQKMWETFDQLSINTEKRAEMGSSYIYMCFYNEDESTLAVFTIYENGACCLGEDFSSFYEVYDGEEEFMKFYEIYTSYSPEE